MFSSRRLGNSYLIEVMRLFEDRAARYGTARTADRSPIADIHGRGCPAQRNTNLGLFSMIIGGVTVKSPQETLAA
jgi:hypothetical protein